VDRVNKRADLALNIFEREYLRLLQWVWPLVDEWSAYSIVYQAFAALLWSGVSGRHTQKGTVAGLYLAAEAPLRRAVEIRGGYLPAGAWKRAAWPSYAEALELAALYSAWVYVHRSGDFGFSERQAVAAGIRRYRPGQLLVPTGSRPAADDAVIMKTLTLAGALMSPQVPQDPGAAAMAREVWERERYRTAATYKARGSLLEGPSNGEEQQDHDTSLPGQAYGDDHLAGLWHLRKPQPVPVVGDSPEPAAD
jgi:hypothetical protein